MRHKAICVLAALAALLLARNLYVILLELPDEAAQGAIYRIVFFHVPCWGVSFSAFLMAGVASVLYLVKSQTRYDDLAVSATEIGVVFTVIGLATGTIWARVIWGIWWTWDHRLTWALVCLLIYLGYLMLRRAIEEPTERARNSAVVSVCAFISVVITYKAIEVWRTQHPGPVLSFRTGGGNIEPAWEWMLLWNFIALSLLAAALLLIRMRQEQTQREIDALRRHAHAL
jgi:heme exporter protein C